MEDTPWIAQKSPTPPAVAAPEEEEDASAALLAALTFQAGKSAPQGKKKTKGGAPAKKSADNRGKPLGDSLGPKGYITEYEAAEIAARPEAIQAKAAENASRSQKQKIDKNSVKHLLS